VSESDQHPIAQLVGDRAVDPIVVAFLDRLRFLKAATHILQELLALCHRLGDRRDTSLTGLVGPDGGGFMAVDDAEWSVVQ
jgi:hypothetical protein